MLLKTHRCLLNQQMPEKYPFISSALLALPRTTWKTAAEKLKRGCLQINWSRIMKKTKAFCVAPQLSVKKSPLMLCVRGLKNHSLLQSEVWAWSGDANMIKQDHINRNTVRVFFLIISTLLESFSPFWLLFLWCCPDLVNATAACGGFLVNNLDISS